MSRTILNGTCDCGCGCSIAGLPTGTLYTPECARRIKTERKRQIRRSSLSKQRHVVDNESPNRRQQCCQVCGGMPWAREHGRMSVGGPVLDSTGRCRGCGGLPGEERIDRPSVLYSSAGAALSHGDEYG
jgi:hypothetical protein